MTLPDKYAWISAGKVPKMLAVGLKYYGMKEGPGSADNPVIMKWAHDFGITWYLHDSTAWCSLAMGQCAKEAEYVPPNKNVLLAAVSWATWGISLPTPLLGAIMVFNRPGGHHVGFYIGEDDTAYYIFGGNTGDAMAITRIAKDRLIAIRWPAGGEVPAPMRRIMLSDDGTPLSQNEA